MKISVCVITLNEEVNLRRCLGSLKGLADEIVVVDSGSTDDTEAVAGEFGARWVERDWPGFREQKNRALDLATHDWVLSLDADEALSEALQKELAALKERGPAEGVTGYSMPRCVFYEGRWIRHGDWYPDRLVRLFLRARARFAGGRVHERLELDGPVCALVGDLEHYSFADAADHAMRCDHYARLWAETAREQGRKAGPLAPGLHAAFRWVRGYVLRAGFLDGGAGWRIACMNAREVYLKYRLLREVAREG